MIGLVNFLLSFATQGSIIFIPLLGADLGASDFQIGVVGAIYGTAFLSSSLYSGWKSDRVGKLVFVRWGLLASSVAFAAQLLAHDILILMLVRGIVGFSLGIATAAMIAYAFEADTDMGKYSSYGSWAGFLCLKCWGFGGRHPAAFLAQLFGLPAGVFYSPEFSP
ncbi:MAG: MFS transporter [Candidatus Syntrophopropionicum ammoniitolerans]